MKTAVSGIGSIVDLSQFVSDDYLMRNIPVVAESFRQREVCAFEAGRTRGYREGLLAQQLASDLGHE